MNRKEIFKREIETGASITEIKVYTNSLRLVLAALSGREYTIVNGRWIFTEYSILSEVEQEKLMTEIKDLQKKIKLYEKTIKKNNF